MTKLFDANGFTYFADADFSKIIYVSDSDGHDGNNGLSPVANPINSGGPGAPGPKKTISAGCGLIGSTAATQALKLKGGDTFTTQSFVTNPGTPGAQFVGAGLSADRPLWITSYGGTARPVVSMDATSNAILHANNGAPTQDHLAITHIKFYPTTRDPASPGFVNTNGDPSTALQIALMNSLLVEDCDGGWFQDPFVLFGNRNMIFRRNIAHHSYSVPANSGQGMEVDNNPTDDCYTIEDNFFADIGPNASVPGSLPDYHNHACYLNYPALAALSIRGNIAARNTDAQGDIMQRGGCRMCELNISIQCLVHLSTHGIGYTGAGTGYPSTVRHNLNWKMIKLLQYDDSLYRFPSSCVAGNGRTDIFENISAHTTLIPADAVWLITLNGSAQGPGGETTGCQVYGNIFWDTNLRDVIAIMDTFGSVNNNVHDNEVEGFLRAGKDYKVNESFTDISAGYPDPNRSIETYMASIGETATLARFIDLKYQQSRFNYDTRLQALPIINYARAGYGKAPLTLPAPSPTPIPADVIIETDHGHHGHRR